MRTLFTLMLCVLLDVVPMGKAFLRQLQQRDSILVGDQLEYGFKLEGVKAGTELGLADFSEISGDTLTLVRNWKVDTLKFLKKERTMDISAAVVMAPFEEGRYELPPVFVERILDGKVDTLLFTAAEMEVKAIPVDTATFVIKDIKGQIRYPLTFKELMPWIGGVLLFAGAVALLVWWLGSRRRKAEAAAVKEPAHITALRNLDKYRGEKFWAPGRQKEFYSGVTDTLKIYMEARFGVDAPEMTTAEVFDALKGNGDITPELFSQTRELFETADFVKFAKHAAPDEYNARVVPVAVRFVTETYRAALEEERDGNVL